MKRTTFTTAVGLTLGLLLASTSHAVEILRWERLPLVVPLVVGQERVIFIDRNVRIGLPSSLGERLRVQSAGGAIYLRANEAIAPTRLQLQDVESGAVILLDIAADDAKEGASELEPVRIVSADTVSTPGEGTARAGTAEKAGAVAPRQTPVAVILTRYAAQNLYAPLRTVEPVFGITRINLRGDLALGTLLPTLPVRGRALAAWRLEDLWVTAVRLSNTSIRWVDLDPRALQGDFVAATFQHPNLGPAGDSSDTTVVYLVTRGRSLPGALLPTLSPVDAALPPANTSQGASDEK